MDELLIKLAPYLPCGVCISSAAGHKYTLCGLNNKEGAFSLTSPVRDTVLYAGNIKPHLRPFSHLTKTIVHKGVEVMPAVEAAKLAAGVRDAALKGIVEEEGYLIVELDAGDVAIFEDWVISVIDEEDKGRSISNTVQVVDLLRSMHFALPPWEVGEYIELAE